MITTKPSIEVLARILGCEPIIEIGPPELGVLKYEVTYESADERLSVQVLPLAEEIDISFVVKNPSRFFKFSLAEVDSIAIEEDSEFTKIEVTFYNENIQPLEIHLKPVLALFWGNQKNSPERSPPWERE